MPCLYPHIAGSQGGLESWMRSKTGNVPQHRCSLSLADLYSEHCDRQRVVRPNRPARKKQILAVAWGQVPCCQALDGLVALTADSAMRFASVHQHSGAMAANAVVRAMASKPSWYLPSCKECTLGECSRMKEAWAHGGEAIVCIRLEASNLHQFKAGMSKACN